MPVSQHNALELDPNSLKLQRVATYSRTIAASLARVWDNVLDWEHLPHLHDASFNFCELDEAGRWGWRVWSNPEHSDHIELCVTDGCYVARSYKGGEQFSEIWTHLTAGADDAKSSPERVGANTATNNTDIRVEFYSTGVTQDNQEAIAAGYLRLYKKLWDEDEAMMCERQRRLDESLDTATEINLGTVADVRSQAPVNIKLNRREYRVSEEGEGWVATPTICPHLKGPLEAGEQPGTLRCPWHGYVFDLQSGECVSPKNARCTLGQPVAIFVQDNHVIVAAE